MIGTIVRILAAGALAIVAVAGPVAAADTAVVARGHCSGESTWRLGLATDGETIWVGYRVDAPVPGELWRLQVVHNDRIVFEGRRLASEPNGILGVRLKTRNTRGPDLIRARALNTVTGETCAGRAVI